VLYPGFTRQPARSSVSGARFLVNASSSLSNLAAVRFGTENMRTTFRFLGCFLSIGALCQASTNCSLTKDRTVGSTKAFSHPGCDAVEECCKICADNPKCAAFNYEASESKCFLQSDADDRGPAGVKPGAVSGIPNGPSPPSPSPSPSPRIMKLALSKVYHHIDPNFKCWTIDASQNREWETRNLSQNAPGNDKLYYLAKASLPGFLRFGGGGNDNFDYLFDSTGKNVRTCTNSSALTLSKQDHHCMNATWFDNFMQFAKASGAKLVFGLNIDRRVGDRGEGGPDRSGGAWDPSQAKSLIAYAIAQNYSFYGFEVRLAPYLACMNHEPSVVSSFVHASFRRSLGMSRIRLSALRLRQPTSRCCKTYWHSSTLTQCLGQRSSALISTGCILPADRHKRSWTSS
jgi:hypothetical protein